jgi:hypothetical protein
LKWKSKLIEKRWQERYLVVKRRLHVCCIYSESSIVPVLISVVRIRLVKTKDTSVCVTVNFKMCRSAMAL